MAEGDTFTLSIQNETYTCQVDRIRVAMPGDLTELVIEPGQDLCTLITCTPYGINTHRLLVRGDRVENAQGEAQVAADALQIAPAMVALFIMVPFVFGLLFLSFAETAKPQR